MPQLTPHPLPLLSPLPFPVLCWTGSRSASITHSLLRFSLPFPCFLFFRFEEYFDYIFPDEAGAAPNLKILEAAYKWKRQKLGQKEGEEDM